MPRPDVKTPTRLAGQVGAGVAADLGKIERHGATHCPAGIHAYEAEKLELLSQDLTPTEYTIACRRAADRTGV
ncbi:MAG: hypothetical protein EG825_17520 [Rhodocyclaceae bacterium]|nr:hypothetical protein [Rhodocyclaceae bacterium]